MTSMRPAFTSPKMKAVEAARKAGAKLAAQQNLTLAHAHFLLAREVAHSKDVTERAWEVVCHLELALAGGYEPEACHANLGQIYLVAGDFRQAEEHLAEVVEQRGDLRLACARALLGLGRQDEASQQARRAKEELWENMQATAPGSAAEIHWLACVEFLEEFDEGVAFLEKRLADGADDYARQALSQLYVSWFDVLNRQEPRPNAEALSKLISALRYAPEHRQTVERLIVIAQQAAKERDPAILRVLHEADLSSHVHLVVGSVSFHAGLPDEGVHHLEKAYIKNPHDPGVLNNLAWFVAHRQPPDLDRAIELADRLIALVPRRVEFRETRGQIHALRKEWEKARIDLELAEKVLPDHPGLHRTLVQVYQALSLPGQAEVHQKKLDFLTKSKN